MICFKKQLHNDCLFLKMFTRLFIFILLLFSLGNNINAQTFLKGKIYELTTDSVLSGVNVFNINTKLSAYSGHDGSYIITAAEGNRIAFSMSGFIPDTITVTYSMLLTQYDVTLAIQFISLKDVTVKGSYRADSLARRNYYRKVYDTQAHIINRQGPENGVGISFSPLNYFASESRKKRELKQRLIKDEREDFIDYSFPVQWVESLTGLHGDSLGLFMYLYRPSYSFCRGTGKEGMLFYINDRLKEFKKPKEHR